MDQALSTFFSYSNTPTGEVSGLNKENEVLEESTSTVDSDDMSSSCDEDPTHPHPHPSSHNPAGQNSNKKSKPMRDISAPFQPSPRATPRFSPMTERDRPADRVDFLSTEFQGLDPDHNITYDKYVGPTPESNWVIPGKLLVGAYPASADDTETFELLTSILKLGITKFVCLQLEYKSNVTESQWRSGQALRPYYEDVSLLVKNKHMFKVLADDDDVCSTDQLSFVHFPIKDCSVTDDGGVFNLAVELVEAIAAGEVLYLHCWGGHGRTGTLVCIMLHLMYNLDATAAMAYCQRTHDLRQCPVVVGSPQTRSQCDQVRRIVDIMMKQEKRHEQAERRRAIEQSAAATGPASGSASATSVSSECTASSTTTNREAAHFTFEEHQQLPDMCLKNMSSVDGEEDEELLCKRMAGKSFDAVKEDGVCHVIAGGAGGTDTQPLPSGLVPPGTTGAGAGVSAGVGGSVSGADQRRQQGLSSSTPSLPITTAGVTLPTTVSSPPHQHTQLTSAAPTAQPPLKFRLVEKNANSTRNAYTQKVLGKSTLPPQSMKQLKAQATDKPSTEQPDVLPVVPAGTSITPPIDDSSVHKVATATATATVQAQPPKHSSPRSSRPGGLKEMRTHSGDVTSADHIRGLGAGIVVPDSQQQVPMQVQSESTELDKSDEVVPAAGTASSVETNSQSQKWGFGNPFSKKGAEEQDGGQGGGKARVVTI